MKKCMCVLFVVVCITQFGYTEPSDSEASRRIGVKSDMTGPVFSGGGYNYGSVGAGFNTGLYRSHAGHFTAVAYGAMTEYTTDNELRIRPYVRIFGGSAGVLLGISGVYATDFDDYSLGIAPEAGIGMWKLNILYRYNYYLNSDYNCHEIVLVLYCF